MKKFITCLMVCVLMVLFASSAMAFNWSYTPVKDCDEYKTIQNDNLVIVPDYITELSKQYDSICIKNLNSIIPYISQLSDNWGIVSNKNFKLTVNGLKSTF